MEATLEKPATKEFSPEDTPFQAGGSVLDADLAKEIEDGITQSIQDEADKRDAEKTEEVEEDFPPEEVQTGESKPAGKPAETGKIKVEEKSDAKEPDAITDEHLERAVRAGMKASDVREFKTPEALERVVSALEGAGKPEGESDESEADGEQSDEDPWSAIPDLDPEEYDEEVVNGFKAVKEIVRQQQETIKALQGGEISVFDSQVGGLGKEATAALEQDGNRAALQEKFDVISAGYEATGKTVEPEAAFKEAVLVVLGESAAKDASAVKSGKLTKRGKQHVSRPTATRTEAKPDVDAETASELDKKYFAKAN